MAWSYEPAAIWGIRCRGMRRFPRHPEHGGLRAPQRDADWVRVFLRAYNRFEVWGWENLPRRRLVRHGHAITRAISTRSACCRACRCGACTGLSRGRRRLFLFQSSASVFSVIAVNGLPFDRITTAEPASTCAVRLLAGPDKSWSCFPRDAKQLRRARPVPIRCRAPGGGDGHAGRAVSPCRRVRRVAQGHAPAVSARLRLRIGRPVCSRTSRLATPMAVAASARGFETTWPPWRAEAAMQAPSVRQQVIMTTSPRTIPPHRTRDEGASEAPTWDILTPGRRRDLRALHLATSTDRRAHTG